ncbi:hypothetical protein FisN_23Lh167 [Fistulifera solaris]|uniref:Protein kinase domain-containing protein n=1 Tax=Fistulifera solaris TaxID=1519565 RepID=A0A1Z5K4Y4_FISSO|nr:hypothetical protein FisN_23Lh167 [Fistulifera solaris]|eukprot:GAX21222.1 hypothetical protein FisN_23Lh167 [Fistulifera solaris]
MMRFTVRRDLLPAIANKTEAVLQACDTFTSAESSDSEHELPADVAAQLADSTLKSVSKRLGNSEYMSGRAQTISKLPHFKRDEIEIGNLIDHGGFAAVYEIKSISKPSELTVHKKKRYVMKNATQTETTTFQHLTTRAKHLAIEGHFLSSLDHENIIKLRGWSTGGLLSYKSNPRLDAFFLIFDYLPEMLTDRMERWAQEQRQRVPFWLRRPRVTASDTLLCERIKVGLDIASALEYLHDKRIIYRDLKPSNVGFQSGNGTLKLFDFGLAVELPLQDDLDQAYKFPGRAGTRRYMSPEVLLERPYNVKADVYSFSILLWEIMALRKPKLPGAHLQVNIPNVKASWPAELKDILKRGWCMDLMSRAHMKEIRYRLSRLHSSLVTKERLEDL